MGYLTQPWRLQPLGAPCRPIQMSKNSGLSQRVTNELRRDIIAGFFQLGTWLKTEHLAARYGVSANPVREALWRLQGEGYVVAYPNQGARVRVVNDDLVRNIFEIREALEPIFMRRFDQRVTASDVARLREAGSVAAFAKVASKKTLDFEVLELANRAFQGVITEGEYNLQAIEAMERYAGLHQRQRAMLPIAPARLRQRVDQQRRNHRYDRVGRCRGGRAGRGRACSGRGRGPAHSDAVGAHERRPRGQAHRGRARSAKCDTRVRDLNIAGRTAQPVDRPHCHHAIIVYDCRRILYDRFDLREEPHGAQRALHRRDRSDFGALRRGLAGGRP